MGLCNSHEIFQEKMSELFVSMDTVRVYIDELLHVTKGYWTEHITLLEEMFTRLQKDGLKINTSKSCFGAHKFDYLGYHVTCDGVMPVTKESRGHSSPRSPKKSQTITSVYRYDQLLPWHVAKAR